MYRKILVAIDGSYASQSVAESMVWIEKSVLLIRDKWSARAHV